MSGQVANVADFDPTIFHLSVLFPDSKKPVFTTPTNDSHTVKSKASISPYFVTAINVAAYFCYVPFQIKLNPVDESYIISHSGLARKIACAMIHVAVTGITILYNVNLLLFTDSDMFTSNFTRTFDFVTSCGSSFLSILFIFTFWRNQTQILEFAEATRVVYNEKLQRKHKYIAVILLLTSYFSSVFIYHFYGNEINLVQLLPFLGDLNQTAFNVFEVLWEVIYHHINSFSYFVYYVIAVVGLSMRGVRKEFCANLTETMDNVDIKKGFDLFMGLKQLSNHVTNLFGNKILVYYIVSVAYFAKIPESSLWNSEGKTGAMLIFFSLGAIMWLLSAEFHMTVRDVIQNWATQMQDQNGLTIDTRIRLMSVVNDNLLDPIGISCKFFTITYGFLGSMLGLIVTYAIIVFQMQAKP